MQVNKALTVIISLVTLVGLGLTLAYRVRPSLKPCLGASSAEFTGTPVFPRVHFRDHLFRTGVSRADVMREPDTVGAEVRFSYEVDDLRGEKVPIRWTLVSVKKDGTLGAVDRSQDRALAKLVTPDTCSETGGQDLFVQIPDPKKRYRVVLEMYRSRDLEERLALAETPVFSG